MTSDPPIPIPGEALRSATCITCRKPVWWIEGGHRAGDGDPLVDLTRIGAETLASIHPCCVAAEDLAELEDDPDYGWISG